MEDKEYIDLTEHRAMIYLPASAVEVTVGAKVYADGQLHEVSKVYDMQEIREMFRKADDGYIDDDDRFVLTDKGRADLEELEKKRG